ncbi:hypothetical protein BJ508DRAFT_377324 [Ascobolus immersus RN42]|uniref:Uncharacterized protein n=1 Tax=Ascobolus immersus RN42 TaxID=1160509 RepID=A0A3N4I386_ASCIM|nr:hypothetical protein BJ508DRAFT_377324 [Ascobolus immersus RN42]
MKSAAVWVTALVAFASAPALASKTERILPKAYPEIQERKGTVKCFKREPISTRKTTIGFEALDPQDLGESFAVAPLLHSRGFGYAYKDNTTNYIVFDNTHNLQVIECDHEEWKDLPESKACGNSTKAIYSGMKQLEVGIGTDYFRGDKSILTFDLKSLYITATENVTDQNLYIEVLGYSYLEEIFEYKDTSVGLEGVRRKITIPQGWTDLNRLYVAVYYVDDQKAYMGSLNFAIDDVEIVEKVYNETICKWENEKAGINYPCAPEPTSTKNWTVNFDDMPVVGPVPSLLPPSYAELNWNYGLQLWNTEILNEKGDHFLPLLADKYPPEKSFLHGNGSIQLFSNTNYEHFGLESFSIYAAFDAELVGMPVVTIVGRRDKFDGSKLPEKVQLEVHLAANAYKPKWSVVIPSRLTDSPGSFSRLRWLGIYLEFVDFQGNRKSAEFLLDELKFTRDIGEGERCRASSALWSETMKFEDNLEPGQLVPQQYEGFAFHPNSFTVDTVKNYLPNENGYIAGTSPNTTLFANGTGSFAQRFYIDAYDGNNIYNKFWLFDFESLVITIDVPGNDLEALNSIYLKVTVFDGCGFATHTVPEFSDFPFTENLGYNYYHRFFPLMGLASTGSSFLDGRRQQFKLMFPWKAISYLEIDVRMAPDYEQVPFWIDDFSYRPNKSIPVPACVLCKDVGSNGGREMLGRMCEVPAVPR